MLIMYLELDLARRYLQELGFITSKSNNLLELNKGLFESWHVMKRAGAQFIITYGARKSKELGFSVK